LRADYSLDSVAALLALLKARCGRRNAAARS
jgi:hypothetical protein